MGSKEARNPHQSALNRQNKNRDDDDPVVWLLGFFLIEWGWCSSLASSPARTEHALEKQSTVCTQSRCEGEKEGQTKS